MLRVPKRKSGTPKKMVFKSLERQFAKKGSQLNFEWENLQSPKKKLASQTTQQKYSAWNRDHIPILILFAVGVILQIARTLV
jgi:hypothetical protein